MSNELKPCPFCGGKAELIKGRENSDTSINYKIMCKNGFKCRCEKHFNVSPYEPNADQKINNAITAWNTRAEPSNEPLTLEQLKQMDREPMYEENENFIQNKFGYCFYTLASHPIIYNLYVHPQYRRCGHSKMLLQCVIDEIRKTGYAGEISIQAEPRENSIELSVITKYYNSMGLIVANINQ